MKTGRPKLSDAEKKAQITGIRLKPDERRLLESAASSKKQNLSVWIRQTLMRAAQRQLSNPL
jgi:uncharacterized protein (DUF1778 family)